MRIVLSIVSHQQQTLVQNLLDSIDRYASCSTHELIIVITENTTACNYVQSKKFSVKFTQNIRRKGFGSNHNAAFEKFESDYFLIVNPDIIFTHNIDFDFLIQSFEEKSLDIASPKILNSFGQVEDYKRADLTISNLLKRMLVKNNKEEFQWFAGMFLMIKSCSFKRLCGFDTKYFMYVEDCDLCMRARKVGMILGDLENFSVIHNAQRSSRRRVDHFKWHITSLLRYIICK